MAHQPKLEWPGQLDVCSDTEKPCKECTDSAKAKDSKQPSSAEEKQVADFFGGNLPSKENQRKYRVRIDGSGTHQQLVWTEPLEAPLTHTRNRHSRILRDGDLVTAFGAFGPWLQVHAGQGFEQDQWISSDITRLEPLP